MSDSIRLGCWFIIAAILCAGCGKKDLPNADSPGPAQALPSVGPPLTNEEYEEFGRKLEKAISSGDKAEIERLLRIVDLSERCISDLNLPSSVRRSLAESAPQASAHTADNIVEVVRSGSRYDFVRVHTIDGRKRALFRLVDTEGVVDYHDYFLARYPDGQIASEDRYIYSNGEPFTQTHRRVLLTLLAQQDKDAAGRLTGEDQVLIKNLESVNSVYRDLKNGRHKEALATYRKLPAQLQKSKSFQLLAIRAAKGTNADDEYLAQIERFHRDFPNDPATDLISIDYFRIKKQIDEALKSIDRLDKSLDGDVYLGVLRAGVYLEAGRFSEARAAVEKALKDDPKLEHGYWVRISISLKEKNHKDTLDWLKKGIESGVIKLDLDDLKDTPDYAEFVKSPESRDLEKWLDARSK